MVRKSKVSAAPVAKKRTKKATKKKATKAAKNECGCGCDGTTGAYFVPGHDARFKGWLLKIERGKAKPADLMPDSIVKKYTWKKSGKGLIPTTNYKGEKHLGYL